MPKPNVLSDQEFRAQARDGNAPAEAQLRKGFIAEVKAGEDDSRSMDFVISTASVDRMGDTIAVDGWKLANFRKNPVVLWAHDSGSMPVAKASNIRVEDGKLMARAEFMPREISGFADAVYRALKGGFLNAVSVGFAPVKYAFSEDDGRKWGIDFLEQELLEFSVVPVPANAEALVQSRSAGQLVDADSPLRPWIEETLGKAGFSLLPKARLEAINAMPGEYKRIAESLPDVASGPRGQLIRCANMLARAIAGEAEPAPKAAGRVEMARRRFDLARRGI